MSNILSIDNTPHYCCAGECVNSCDESRRSNTRWLLVARLLAAIWWWRVCWWRFGGGEMTLGGEFTCGESFWWQGEQIWKDSFVKLWTEGLYYHCTIHWPRDSESKAVLSQTLDQSKLIVIINCGKKSWSYSKDIDVKFDKWKFKTCLQMYCYRTW